MNKKTIYILAEGDPDMPVVARRKTANGMIIKAMRRDIIELPLGPSQRRTAILIQFPAV